MLSAVTLSESTLTFRENLMKVIIHFDQTYTLHKFWREREGS